MADGRAFAGRPFIGILLMLGAGLCFAALDATSKHLTQTFPVPMLVWARYTVHLLLMLIFLWPSMRTRLVATRRPLALTARALMLVGTVSMSLAAPLYWGGPLPDAWQGLGIASLGIYGGAGHLLMTRAFRHAPASTLSPFLYAQLIWATLLGWLFHARLPGPLSVAGMTVIAGSSLSIALSERFRQAEAARDRDTAC